MARLPEGNYITSVGVVSIMSPVRCTVVHASIQCGRSDDEVRQAIDRFEIYS